ncbi:metadherin a isoform X9 [Neoarius graeffei]|uniref:metadherin a isoform X9 n=1 Tax=Neoarius graeffei TaxID=443677 RepID=UPI00298BE14C|nr:metadherin a isoform X9 [Neoarius graeffei]
MASSWGGVVSEQADLISSRLRQLVSSGLHFLHDELGIDLGLKPELYPAWVILFSTALIGLVLLLVLVAACGGARRRKQGAARGKSTAVVSATESVKATPVKAPKPDEPKKKNKKKTAEKKNQSNGGTVPEPREQVKVVKEFPKQATPQQPRPPPPAAARPPPPAAARPPPPAAARPPPPAAARPPPPQPPVDVKAEKAKKGKKKPKPEVKPTQAVSSTDGKEPDEESLNLKATKGDANVTPAVSTWNNVSAVNSGAWTGASAKLPPQVNASDREKSSAGVKTSGHRTSEQLAWTQESEAGSWSSMDGRIKPEVHRMNFSMLRLNPSGGVPMTQPAAESGNGLPVADEWSGYSKTNNYGLGATDPSSDWNAPTEVWGNYDEPKPETPAAQEMPVSQVPRLQESDEDKDKGDPSGSGKSKRKKKKKKKPEDENAGSQVTTESSTAPAESGSVKPHPHVPVGEPTKQIITQQSGQKKSDQNLEPLKQVQKKKARRET